MNCSFNISDCGSLDAQGKCKNCGHCFISLEESIHSRRCFMTGEYCSQQTNIQKQRKKMHKQCAIIAFVVMNFSDMSKVVYKWRLRTFIESISSYLYIHQDTGRLYCNSEKEKLTNEGWEKVKKIQVVRADSDYASNYVICSRICQQMQMADLVIVDVSNQNPNVFYEFGMAVALGKLILPICYSESYYKRILPKNVKESDDDYETIEHHIDCYPWRRTLFEYYGIHYRRNRSAQDQGGTRYEDFHKVKNIKYGFSDIKYARFPYHEVIDGKPIGETIYQTLKEQYEEAEWKYNTLVVYTMEGFLNEQQAGACIVNFYHDITARMRQEQCFSGERVGVLVQENAISESDKDTKNDLTLPYDIGEIIHIGLNQATYQAALQKIKTKDVLKTTRIPDGLKNGERKKHIKRQKRNIIRYVKGYIRNRGILIYPNNPVYVNRIRNRFQQNILEPSQPKDRETCSCSRLDAFCLYHVMLKTLHCTNQIVVDISNNYSNCLQSLFWLGAAHGLDIYAITVLHEETDSERKLFSGTVEKKIRNIFDVAGLWTAILRSNDTEGFYEQLAIAQKGLEHHSKLMLPSRETYEKKMRKYLYLSNAEKSEAKIKGLYKKKKKEEKRALESYYRTRFWTPMLRYNRLRIYLPQEDVINTKDNEPRLYTVKWDLDAVSALSNYLSKRKVIGEYLMTALNENENDREAEQVNFICVGNDVKPLGESLASYINKKKTKNQNGALNVLHEHLEKDDGIECINIGQKENYHGGYKGFHCPGSKGTGIFTRHPYTGCLTCAQIPRKKTEEQAEAQTEKQSEKHSEILLKLPDTPEQDCRMIGKDTHIEIAQLILWRETPENSHNPSLFRVAIIGSSGPATLGLSMLFVDEEQRNKGYEKRKGIESENYLLSKLQAAAREKFMRVFMEKLKEKLQSMPLESQEGIKAIEGEQKDHYIYLVECAVSSYLSTMLYRYFLPFLSEKDINRICNAMHTFLNSMKAAKVSPFAEDYQDTKESRYDGTTIANENIRTIVDKIPKILLSVLRSFKGLEAFYEIRVRHGFDNPPDPEKDTRIVEKIQRVKEKDFSNVNCIFCFEDGK